MEATGPYQDGIRLPTHRRRLEAFAIDVLVVAVVLGLALVVGELTDLSTLQVGLVAAVGWVYYVGVTAWLMDGQSAGKVISGLRLQRLGPGANPASPKGLLWSVGRQTVGYVITDVFVLGAVLVLLNRRRRALHDWAFASIVVEAEAPHQLRGPFLQRYRTYWEQFADRYDDLQKNNRWFFFPWKWLSKVLVLAAVWIDKIAPATASTTLAPHEPAKPLATKSTAAIWVTTAAATVTVGAAVARSPDADVLDLAGTWELRQVETENQGVIDPVSFEGAVLEFSPDGDDGFVVVQGPGPLQGSRLSPRVVGNDDVLARAESSYRYNCVDSGGALVAEDVYAMTAAWEFTEVEPTAAGQDRPQRLGLHFLETGEKDVASREAAACPDTIRYEVTATALLEPAG